MNNPFTWDEYKTWRALNIEEQYPDAKSKYKKGEVKSVQVRCGGGCRAIPIILIKFAFIGSNPEKGSSKISNLGWCSTVVINCIF